MVNGHSVGRVIGGKWSQFDVSSVASDTSEDNYECHLYDSVLADCQHQLPGFVKVKADHLMLDVVECCKRCSAKNQTNRHQSKKTRHGVMLEYFVN